MYYDDQDDVKSKVRVREENRHVFTETEKTEWKMCCV